MSMRILPLNNISFKSNNIQAKESEKSPEKKSRGLSNSAKLGIGLLGSAALGVATYYVLKGKKLADLKMRIEKSINDTLAGLKSDIEDLGSKSVKKLANDGYKVQYSNPAVENKSSLQDVLLFDSNGKLQKRIVSKFDSKSNSTTYQLFVGDPDLIIKKPAEIDSECLVKEVVIKKSAQPSRNITINRNKSQVQYHDNFTDGKLSGRSVYKVNLETPGIIEFNRSEYACENGKISNTLNKSLKFKSDVEHLLLNNVLKSPNGAFKAQFVSTIDSKDALLDTLIFNPSGDLQKRVVSKFDPQTNSIIHKLYQGDVEQIINKPNSIDNKCLIKEVTVEDFEPFIQDTLARNIIVKRENSQKQYQDYFRKAKLYERSVYDEDLKKKDAIEVTRYNYAYENGNYIATAKQSVYKNGHQHGVYKDGKFEVFPMYIRKKGEQNFSELKDAYSADSLRDFDSTFDPYNL